MRPAKTLSKIHRAEISTSDKRGDIEILQKEISRHNEQEVDVRKKCLKPSSEATIDDEVIQDIKRLWWGSNGCCDGDRARRSH